MFQKFQKFSDNELVFEYKKTHQEDLELEIISRYQKNAKRLAGLLFSKFKFLYQVEYDDIYSILLSSLFTTIKGFNDEKLDFYQYWKSSATHEVVNYVSDFSHKNNDMLDEKGILNDEVMLSGYLRDRCFNMKDDYLWSFELDDILTNPKSRLLKIDADIFRLYLAGYKAIEISRKVNIPLNKIRYRLKVVKRKLANILFNQ